MTTLAIVSSYSESCGNAAFTRILHDSIEAYSDVKVEVVELNLKLLQSTDRVIRRAATLYIHEMCQRLQTFDAVNIQLEASLFGTLPSDIVTRVKKIIRANPNTTVTLHSPRLIPSGVGFRSGIKKLLRLKIRAGLGDLSRHFLSNVHIRINKKIIKYAIKHQCRLIVHTLRAQEQIQVIYRYDNIDVHPLRIVPEDFQPNRASLVKIKESLGLGEDDTLIGIFGYISPYKGHHDAISAMEYLPDNYKLLIFGRQHPQTLNVNGDVDDYLLSLLELIRAKKELGNRIFFVGELSDTEFLHMAASVDLAWLPYYENGQDGSGIASICMELCRKVLCSTSFAFDELFKLVPYSNYLRFDVGNVLEVAHKTKVMVDGHMLSDSTSDKPSLYTIQSQAGMYVKELGDVCHAS